MLKKILMSGLIIFLSITLPIFAQQETVEEESEDAEWENLEEAEKNSVPLGQNVKMIFSLEPAEDDDESLCVVTAVSLFEAYMFYDGMDGEWYFGAEGEVSLIDGKILVEHETNLSYSGEDDSSDLRAKSGALLEDGQSIEVAKFGDRSLVISASIIKGQ